LKITKSAPIFGTRAVFSAPL